MSQTPVQVVDLGKRKKKQFKDMSKNRGRLLDDHEGAVSRLAEEHGDDAVIVPIMVVFKKKVKKKKRRRQAMRPMMVF
ncbi:MAG: hypothetical protein AAGF11_24065 [Myxococcota bacterium]